MPQKQDDLLRETVRSYISYFPEHSQRLSLALNQIANDKQITNRKNFIGHFTASIFLLCKSTNRILLLKHKSLGMMLQPGGHIDDGESPLQAAIRELEEETGFKAKNATLIRTVPGQEDIPFDIDTHFIPENPRKNESSHYHHDLRYLFVTKEETPVSIRETESDGFKWTDWSLFSSQEKFARTAAIIKQLTSPKQSTGSKNRQPKKAVIQHIPKFVIKTNRELDQATIIEFMHCKNPVITQVFPHFTSEQAIKSGIKNIYEENHAQLDETVSWLERNTSTLYKLASIIADKLDYDWNDIPNITIIPALSPIAPRFIESSSFLVPFHADHNWILHTSAHEMVHFLYFKKLKDLSKDIINTEYPSADWLISEIVAPIIVNDDKIQKIVKCKDDPLYSPDPNIISDKTLRKIIILFKQNSDLLKFRHEALKELGQK